MSNLYSLPKAKRPSAICFWRRTIARASSPTSSSIVRAGPDGERELLVARRGVPSPPQYGGAAVTNICKTPIGSVVPQLNAKKGWHFEAPRSRSVFSILTQSYLALEFQKYIEPGERRWLGGRVSGFGFSQ
jgi:hypothetical protein